MKKKFLFLIAGSILLLMFSAVRAQGAGTTAATFLKLGVGAKNIAMGETGATDMGPDALHWNPAGISEIEGNTVSFSHAMLLSDIGFENASYCTRFPFGAMGISFDYLTMPAIDRYDNTGTRQKDSFTPMDAAGAVTYANTFGPIPLGVTLRYIYSQLDEKAADAVSCDVGAFFHRLIFPESDRFRIGLVVQNIGTPMKFVNESFSLPTNVKFGVSYILNENLNAEVDVNQALGTKAIGNAGIEYSYSFSEDIWLMVRGGVKSNTEGLGGVTGLTGGIGFTYQKISVDYAYVPYGDLDTTQRITLNFGF